jgi:hypothetical protein
LKVLQGHPYNSGIKVDALGLILCGQNDVIKVIDHSKLQVLFNVNLNKRQRT